jgi:hypothetical protein
VRNRRGGARRPSASASAGVMMALLTAAVCDAPTDAQISEAVFTIQATNDSGSGSYVATFSDGAWDPEQHSFDWALPG